MSKYPSAISGCEVNYSWRRIGEAGFCRVCLGTNCIFFPCLEGEGFLITVCREKFDPSWWMQLLASCLGWALSTDWCEVLLFWWRWLLRRVNEYRHMCITGLMWMCPILYPKVTGYNTLSDSVLSKFPLWRNCRRRCVCSAMIIDWNHVFSSAWWIGLQLTDGETLSILMRCNLSSNLKNFQRQV